LRVVSGAEHDPSFQFRHEIRVGFDETDAQGVVYYGRYMPYFDRARTEYLRHLGLLHTGDATRQFVMRANRVEYHAPARFDDVLTVYVRVERIGTTSVEFAFSALNDRDERLCTAYQTLVRIDAATRRPVAVDDQYRTAVDAFEGHATGAGAAEGADARRAGAVAVVDRIVNREQEADTILRQTVAALARRYDAFCGIRFVENDAFVLGPSAGEPFTERTVIGVTYDGSLVAEIVLGVDTDSEDRTALAQVATRVSPYCLVGWDIGGETWQA
jgi:acyl-CoA thioester hydrolase